MWHDALWSDERIGMQIDRAFTTVNLVTVLHHIYFVDVDVVILVLHHIYFSQKVDV